MSQKRIQQMIDGFILSTLRQKTAQIPTHKTLDTNGANVSFVKELSFSLKNPSVSHVFQDTAKNWHSTVCAHWLAKSHLWSSELCPFITDLFIIDHVL